jgi:hypothetical protein
MWITSFKIDNYSVSSNNELSSYCFLLFTFRFVIISGVWVTFVDSYLCHHTHITPFMTFYIISTINELLKIENSRCNEKNDIIKVYFKSKQNAYVLLW